MSEEQQKALAQEIVKRLDGIVQLYGRPEDNFGKTVHFMDLPALTRSLMTAAFQEGIRFSEEKFKEIQAEAFEKTKKEMLNL